MHIRSAAALMFASLGLSCFMPATCGPPAPPTGQFGAYRDVNAVLHLSTGDTLKAFAPYVEHLHLEHAILTATILSRAAKALPPADTSSTPRIIQPDGRPFDFLMTPPTQPVTLLSRVSEFRAWRRRVIIV